MIAESALISTHLINILPPVGSLPSPSSPASDVRPLIIAVRRGGLVMPLRTMLNVSGGVAGLTRASTARTVDCGKKGLRPSLGWLGIEKTDCGTGTSGTPSRFCGSRTAALVGASLGDALAATGLTRAKNVTVSEIEAQNKYFFFIISFQITRRCF